MGALVEAAGIRAPAPAQGRPSSVTLSSQAAADVLGRAGCALEEIDLLVNAGVYRDHHICEPAMAPLIQRAIRSDSARRFVGAPLTFDLANGAGGLLNAFHSADALLRARGLRAALVVASDVDPTPGSSEGYRFSPLGAAVLLRPGAAGAGFVDFRFDRYPAHAGLYEAGLDWEASAAPRAAGRASTLRFRIREHADFLERCVECAASSFGRFLADVGLVRDAVDLVVAAQHPEGFAERFAAAIGLEPARVARRRGCAYTAGLAAGLDAAISDGRFRAAREVVFVAAGAGISVSIARYRSDGASASDGR